jgi:hypothetical protein
VLTGDPKNSGPHFDPFFLEIVEVVSAAGSALAAFLAVGSIIYAVAQSRANARLIADERHTGHQLDLLDDLLDLVNEPGGDRDRQLVRWRAAHARLRMIDAELPYTRVRFTVDPLGTHSRNQRLGISTDDSIEYPDDQPTGVRDELDRPKSVRDLMFDEVCDAVTELASASPKRVRGLRQTARDRRAQAENSRSPLRVAELPIQR